jgi:hypothetical protein
MTIAIVRVNPVTSLVSVGCKTENLVEESCESVREICVYQLCIVMHSDANQATDAPVTG